MGFATHAVKSLKANRALLKHRGSFSKLRKHYVKLTGDTYVAHKTISPFEQKKLHDKIRAEARMDRLKEVGVYLISLALTILIIYLMYLLIFP